MATRTLVNKIINPIDIYLFFKTFGFEKKIENFFRKEMVFIVYFELIS